MWLTSPLIGSSVLEYRDILATDRDVTLFDVVHWRWSNELTVKGDRLATMVR
jgi:hypothetical protein